MNIHLIHLCEKKQLPLSSEYQRAYRDLAKKCNLTVYYTYHAEKESNYYNGGWEEHHLPYNNTEKLLQTLLDLSHSHKLIINTVNESLVPLLHRAKKELGQKVTADHSIFTDKNKERSIIQSQHPHTVPQSIAIQLGNDNTRTNKIQGLEFPLVLKPAAGVGSRGVSIVHSHDEITKSLDEIDQTITALEQKNIENSSLILEEYIEGQQYGLTYRVDDEQHITLSIPTEVYSIQDAGLPGHANWMRVIRKNTINKLNYQDIYQFINETVEAGSIANTYVHHECRYTPGGRRKTIELNGRIGGYRIEMNALAGSYNMYDPMIGITTKQPIEITNNVMTMSIWPQQGGVLEGFNKETLNKIESLESFYTIRKKNKLIGEKVGHATHGFEPLGTIVLKHQNDERFEKDCQIVRKLYQDLILVR